MKKLIYAVLLLFSFKIFAAPTGYGYGSSVTGGDGGTVVTVTR